MGINIFQYPCCLAFFFYKGDLENFVVNTGIKHLKESRKPLPRRRSLRQPRGAALRGIKCNWKCRKDSGAPKDDRSIYYNFLAQLSVRDTSALPMMTLIA